MSDSNEHPNSPLHGITLHRMLDELVERVGWGRMGREVKIACFTNNPTVPSSLAFLRRTPWARAKVEAMYVTMTRQTSGPAGS